MNAPVILCPEFIGIARGLINRPEYRLSPAGRALFYDVTAVTKLLHVLKEYDKVLENECYLVVRYEGGR